MTMSKRSTAPGRSSGRASGALLLPAAALLIGFFLVPVGFIAFYSLGYKPGLLQPIATDKLSFGRFAEALDSTFLDTFRSTVTIALLATALCLLIALPFADWLAFHVPSRLRLVVFGVLLIPIWTNYLLRVIGWQITLSSSGWLSTLLSSAHVISSPLDVLDTRLAVQIGIVYNYLVYMILPIYVTLDRLSPALREASRDLGAGRWATFRQVTLPLARPGIIAGCLLVFIPLMGDYLTASLLGGAAANMVGQLVVSQFLTAQNWALGAAMAVVLVAITLLIVGLVAAGLALVGWLARTIRGSAVPEGAGS